MRDPWFTPPGLFAIAGLLIIFVIVVAERLA